MQACVHAYCVQADNIGVLFIAMMHEGITGIGWRPAATFVVFCMSM